MKGRMKKARILQSQPTNCIY